METVNEGCYILRDAAKINEQKLKGYKGQLEKVKQEIAKTQERAAKVPTKLRELRALEEAYSTVEEEEQKVLYTQEDAETAISLFEPIIFSPEDDEKTVQIAEGIEAKFIPTNHINGSCMIELKATYGDEERTVLFTGDIANGESYLYKKRTLKGNDKVCAIVMEGLHGNEDHLETMYDSYKILMRLIKQARRNGRMVIIPTFSLDRSATILAMLNHMMKTIGNFKIFIDSPLTERELMCYISSYSSLKSAWYDYEKPYPFNLDNVTIVKEYGDHMELSRMLGVSVILTSSGMGNGGRVLDYFRNHVQHDASVFVFPGYLVEECPSRILLDTVRGTICELNGEKFVKQCQTVQLYGLSSHGYMPEKWDIIDAYPNADTVFINHGEQESVESIRDQIIEGTNGAITVYTPELGDTYNL
jgi:Cft2 family RNA processing exonuclease